VGSRRKLRTGVRSVDLIEFARHAAQDFHSLIVASRVQSKVFIPL
jgi:hypothetical protein